MPSFPKALGLAGYKVVGVWKEIASGAKQERAERKKVLALAQARKVDVILVTELTRWGRSARFAARSLTCFKFRFVSSPLFGKKAPAVRVNLPDSAAPKRFYWSN